MVLMLLHVGFWLVEDTACWLNHAEEREHRGQTLSLGSRTSPGGDKPVGQSERQAERPSQSPAVATCPKPRREFGVVFLGSQPGQFVFEVLEKPVIRCVMFVPSALA